LYAARHLQPVLDEAASSHGIEIGLTPPPKEQDRMLKVFRIPELGGLSLAATRSRVPLVEALRRLDVTLLVMAAGTLAAALVFAGLLSRGLARPIVELSEQAGRAVHGDPVPVRGRGGRELRHLADAFNRAISDLASLRRRLALTERIAARREIARRVAHEIKNPLAPIRTAVETLRRLRARNDPAFEDYFDEATRTVLDEVVRINTIVTEFTRFARLPPPQPVRHDLVESVRKVVGLHARDDIQIRVDAPTVLDVLADRDQMVQVLTNLLQNAIDACASAPDPHIAVTLEKDGDGARLSVRDNGPGLSEEVRSRLFEPYVTTKPHGTGLGLAIVERIVVEHDGEIRYADAAEGGAEFIIHLPGSGPISSAPRPTA
jgi:nitrogen fixation/metabolism regulation signal transduction histidine kinase